MTNGTKQERFERFETNSSKYKTSYYGHFSSIEFLKKYKHPILNFINKDNADSNKYNIFLMTNKDLSEVSASELNRNKHLGAQFCAKSETRTTYYFITQSIWQDNTGNYLSLNADQCTLIKNNTTDIFKVILINANKLYVFEHFSEDIIDGYKVNISNAVNSYKLCNADYRKPILGSTIKLEYLGNVRYKPMKNNQLHAKQIRIYTENLCTSVSGVYLTNMYDRTFSSILKAYVELTGTKVVDNKPVGIPLANAPYRKSYSQFRRDIKNNKLQLLTRNNTKFNVVTEIMSIRKDEQITIIGIYNNTNNNDIVINDQENCNNKQLRLDKQLNKLADKLMETADNNVSVEDIKASVISFGSNSNMLQAYADSLNSRGLCKEAVYAIHLFEVLNTTL